AGVRDQRLNLSRTFGKNFFGKCRHRQLTRELRQFSHATMPTSEAATRGDRLWRSHRIERGQSKHCAARTVQISSDAIQNVNQPLTQTAELLGAHSDAPIADCRFGPRKLSRQVAHFAGSDAGNAGNSLW